MNAAAAPPLEIAPVNNFETNAGSFRPGAAAVGARASAVPKRVMDVEDVLRWAFRDELPKTDGLGGSGGYGLGYSCPLGRMVAIGASVDNWNREPGHPEAMGPADPDAFLVAGAVADLAAMADQAVMVELDLVPDFGTIGVVDEAAAVRRALAQLPAIVARYAKMGERPTWRVPTVPGPALTGSGRVQVVRWSRVLSKVIDGVKVDEQQLVPVEAGGGKDNYPADSYCPVEWTPSLQSIAEARADYLVWWGALDAIAIALTGQLDGIHVLPPLAPQRPWRDEGRPVNPPLILNDREGRAFRRESRETAAAHRMLGQRRAQNFRGGARPGMMPTRMVPSARPGRGLASTAKA